ncbi:hypothetical protein SAMN05421682_10723 [Chryseobacterium indoltheticum]|uniref:Bacteriocin n=2 Tax=Chryseobacterium indoltheticum TaxID=254 RepID=A0A381JQA5_9FLAO|nr:hypothetical protein SAMN05421682_10723 [Chryseobacterium indoltheticum]SUY53623.1 Uncharacterised protein [Chryseobacterium indoltheticum]
MEYKKILSMKNLKKLDRSSLKKLKGGDLNLQCNLECRISYECKIGCHGIPQCVPKGQYIPENC